MRRIAASLLVIAAVTLTGCLDVEQTLTLEKDLSGKAGFSMKVNMEPMAFFMAKLQHQMSGQEGEPTAAEIEKVRQEMLASKRTEQKDPKAEQAELRKSLPPGVQLLESKVEDEGLGMNVHLAFAFDHASKLGLIRLPKSEGAADPAAAAASAGDAPGAPGPKNPFDEPFGDLQITDEGKTLLLTSKTVNPMAEQQSEMGGGGEVPPEVQKQVEEMFKGLRIAYKIQAPFEVVETNATRREGKTLIWEWDLKSLEKMKPEQLAQGVRVRYRK
jgi:hypothetical protein